MRWVLFSGCLWACTHDDMLQGDPSVQSGSTLADTENTPAVDSTSDVQTTNVTLECVEAASSYVEVRQELAESDRQSMLVGEVHRTLSDQIVQLVRLANGATPGTAVEGALARLQVDANLHDRLVQGLGPSSLAYGPLQREALGTATVTGADPVIAVSDLAVVQAAFDAVQLEREVLVDSREVLQGQERDALVAVVSCGMVPPPLMDAPVPWDALTHVAAVQSAMALNHADAVALVIETDGAADAVLSLLTRIGLLALESSSDLLSATERDYVQAEFFAVSATVGQIASVSAYGGLPTSDGLFASVELFLDVEAGVLTHFQLLDLTAATLGVDQGAMSLATRADALDALGQIAVAVDGVQAFIDEIRPLHDELVGGAS